MQQVTQAFMQWLLIEIIILSLIHNFVAVVFCLFSNNYFSLCGCIPFSPRAYFTLVFKVDIDR